MCKLLLVDGSNLLFQMFYGMPARINDSEGRPVHGVVGFVGALLKIIRTVNPTHVAVLFDGECASARKELVAEYKANRPDYSLLAEADNPYSQLSFIYGALNYLALKHAETTCCETDDWIAAYALTYSSKMQVVISSFDSDFFQLISDSVSVLRYRGKNTAVLTPDFVRSKFGIEPDRYADFKAMVGDAADNIKGVPKVGAKTAASLINQFGSLSNILSNVEGILKPSVRRSVAEHAEQLKTNYRLIKLTDSAALPFDLNSLKYRLDSDVSTRSVLQAIGVL